MNVPRGLLKSVIATTRRDICGDTRDKEIWEFIALGINLLPNPSAPLNAFGRFLCTREFKESRNVRNDRREQRANHTNKDLHPPAIILNEFRCIFKHTDTSSQIILPRNCRNGGARERKFYVAPRFMRRKKMCVRAADTERNRERKKKSRFYPRGISREGSI